jgi:hypothetical protein
MNIGVLLFVTVIMTIVQISVWQIFPSKVRDVIMANPVLAFLINLAGSGMIAAFTGAASLVGICNMGASCLFGVYAWWYCKHNHIVGLGCHWYKLWNVVAFCPRIMVQYKHGDKEWYQ